MTKDARRKQILDIITTTKAVTSSELSAYFHVTEETIRKDLTYLSGEGLIIRTFGGATAKETNESSLEQRNVYNYPQKSAIAAEASNLIQKSDLIVMDAGSTTSALAKCIPENSEVIVITNSLDISVILLQKAGVTLISTGGKLNTKSMSYRGDMVKNAIKLYNIQKAFISCSAIDIKRGIMDTNEEEAAIKQCMIAAAGEVYLLADSSKFNKIAHITTSGFEKITAIYTDCGIDPQTADLFRAKGICLKIVE